jgi:LuxR family transcriptional regulator, maltose regulon positive regulatory protein
MEGRRSGLPRAITRETFVRRSRLVGELERSIDVPVVLVVAGGGYGKTTLVAQWLEGDERPVEWLSATRRLDDPAVFVTELAGAFDAIEPAETRDRWLVSSLTLDFSSVVVPRLERTVAEIGRPFVLVVDDAHVLQGSTSWSLVQTIADVLPAGSQLVLVSRTKPPLALGRMRADRRVHEISAQQLAMDQGEAGALLSVAGLSLPSSAVDEVWTRTEGWPVGLYLATLAIGDADDPVAAAQSFAGDDRIVVDYVTEELLSVLPRPTHDFLLRVSILDELSAPVCNEVLGREDSAGVLRDVAASFPLLIPLDRRGDAFRMHQLLRDTMQSELGFSDPDLFRELHRRAACWYEARGDLDRVVEHLQHADDPAELERVIWKGTVLYGGIGRAATVERWLETFSDDELRARPALAASCAWVALLAGDMSALRYWVDVVSGLGEGVLPDGNPVTQQAALLRALIGEHGIDTMCADAQRAYERDVTGSPFRSIARYIEGGALRLQGRRVEARARLIDGEAIGSVVLPASQAHCLAQLAALAIDEGDWEAARRDVARLLLVLDRYQLRERPAQAVSLAIAGWVLAHSGDSTAARAEAKQALFLVSMLSTVAPWISIETRIALVHTFLLLGDVSLARTLTREAVELLVLVPDGVVLGERLRELEQSVEAAALPAGVLATPLTPAEMRLLRYLPTHLTFGSIATELFVSRNTVKSQAVSIYRKLGVSSRGPAVDAARGLGLLDDEERLGFTRSG